MKKSYILVFTVLSAFVISSCTSQKKLAYFNSVASGSADSINLQFKSKQETEICVGDMLIITVSGLDPEAVAPFNLPVVAYASPGSDKIYSTPSMQTYIVDTNGNINFPVLGKLKLNGVSKADAIDLITSRLKPYLKDPIVNIQFVNYNITVLGEVMKPGKYAIPNERVTILDALGYAGDMTVYGRRENVLVTRENNGKLEFGRLNLNSDKVFTSPFFYLQQNDVVYVEPNTVKSISSQNIPLYLSSISTLATLVTLIYTVSKSTPAK